MTPGYRARALSALKWSVSGAVAVQSIGFVFGIALARLLSPREFGLMVMLTVLTQFAAQISLGFEETLIQRRDLAETHRSTVFWVMLFGSVALALGLVACLVDVLRPVVEPSRLGDVERLAFDVAAGILVYWVTLQVFQVRAYLDVVGVLRRPAPVAKGAEGHAS